MSESNLTPHTAPRSVEGLMAETPFKLRLLLTDLGGLQSEEQKMGWHQLSTPDARANHVLAVLRAWDQVNPGAAQPPPQQQMNGTHMPPPQQMPPQQQMQPPPQQQFFNAPAGAPNGYPASAQQAPQGFQMPQQTFVAPQPVMPVPAAAMMGAPGAPPPVSPQAAQAAATAAQGENGKTTRKRTPSTNGADAGGAELGAQVLTALQTILQGLGAESEQRNGWQKQITDMLEEAASSKASRVTALEAKYGEVAQGLHNLAEAMKTQQQLQIWTLMAFLTLAEQQSGASTVQILGAAISDSAMFQKFVNQATGKA